MFIILITPMI